MQTQRRRLTPCRQTRPVAALLGALLLACSSMAYAGESLTFDQDDQTAGAQGVVSAPATWNAVTANDVWLDGQGNQTYWTSGADATFGGTAGRVKLSENILASSLNFNVAGYVLDTAGRDLTVSGAVTGLSFDLRNDQKKTRGLILQSDATFTGKVFSKGWYGYPTLTADGATLTFQGSWDGGYGSVKSYLLMKNGGRVLVDAGARLNNMKTDLKNSRSFYIRGEGLDEVVEFAPGFQADHTGWDDQLSYEENVASFDGGGVDGSGWHADGLAGVIIGDCTWITHSSQSLPSIHQWTPTDLADHHGMITIRPNGWGEDDWKGFRWIVRSTDQTYDGGVNWYRDWTLVTEADLTLTGVFTDDTRVSFGNRDGEGKTVTKEGDGTLRLAGSQAYSAGSTLLVRAGAVVFETDPGTPNDLQIAYNWPTRDPGQHLSVTSDYGATVTFDAPTNRIDALNASGTTVVAEGRLELATDLEFGSDHWLEIHAVGSLPAVSIGRNTRLHGHLKVSSVPNPHQTYTLLESADPLEGFFVVVQVPEGMQLAYQPHRVLLVPSADAGAPVPGFGAWSLIALTGLLLLAATRRLAAA